MGWLERQGDRIIPCLWHSSMISFVMGWLERQGDRIRLDGNAQLEIQVDDVLVIETPGGGFGQENV